MEINEENAGRELAKRNPLALEYVMNEYANSVYGLVRRVLGGAGSAEDAEECVSDAFVALWNKSDAFDPGRGTLKTFVLIQAKYKALGLRRKLLHRPGTEPVSERLPDRAAVEDEVLTKEASRRLVELIDGLPEPDRSIFCCKYFYYETAEQIAALYGLTVKAVENRLFRARKAIRRQFREWPWEEDRHA